MKSFFRFFPLLTKIILFIFFTIVFTTAKVYQFQAQNPDSLKDILFTFDEFILELREDGFFYNVENNKKAVDLKDKKKINYTLEYKGSQQSKEIDLNGSVIRIDLSSFKKDNKNLNVITKATAKKAQSIPASKFSLSGEEGRRIPGAGNDILRSVVALPGVQGSADANGEIYIRGSDKEDIYYAINSVRISNPFHSMAFYSAIPNLLISSLNVYLGGFDSKFYNSQGGVIQVVSKGLNEYPIGKASVEAELALSIAGLNVNIPIAKNIRLNLGMRRSYYELLFALTSGIYDAISEENRVGNQFANSDNNITPYFFDANIFLDWDYNENHKFKFFTVFSDDGFKIKFPPVSVPTTTSTDDEGVLTVESNDININMDTQEGWNVQAVEYTFKASDKIENLLSVYRYYVTNNTSVNDRQLSFFTRDQYAIKDDLKFFYAENLTFLFGVFFNIETANVSIFENKDGKKEPLAQDYGLGHDNLVEFIYKNPIFYSIVRVGNALLAGDDGLSGILGAIALENYKAFEDAYADYTDNLVEKNQKPTRFQMSGYASADYSPIENLLLHGGLNSTFNTYSKKFSVDPRMNASYFLFNQFTFSLKTGIYSQMPDLYVKDSFTVNPEEGLAIVQRLTLLEENLKTPYSYHFNLGVNTSFLNIFEASIDGYYKYMEDQILINPTYDSKYSANPESNPRSVNSGRGQAYGVDIFIKQRFINGNFGWISYSWTKSLRYRFLGDSYAFVGTDPENNGNDYKNTEMGWVPFSRVAEHNLRIVYSLTPNKTDIFGIRLELSSGLPYTPKVIDKRYVKKDGTTVWSIRDGKLFSENYPMKWKIDFRYDRIMFEVFGVEVGYFFDIASLEKYFSFLFAPTVSYSMSTEFLRDIRQAEIGEGPLKDFKDGDPVPRRYYINSAKAPGNLTAVFNAIPIITGGILIRY